jgi:hypothetical protein
MPPQQPDRLLDLFNESLDFGAHGLLVIGRGAYAPPCEEWDVAAQGAKRNRCACGWRVFFSFVLRIRRFPPYR